MKAKDYRKQKKEAVETAVELAAEGVPVEPVYLQVDCPICGAKGVVWDSPDTSLLQLSSLKLCPLHLEEVRSAASKFVSSYVAVRSEPVSSPVIEEGANGEG